MRVTNSNHLNFDRVDEISLGSRVLVRHKDSGLFMVCKVLEEKKTFFRLSNGVRISKDTYLPKPLSLGRKIEFFKVSERALAEIEDVNKRRKMIPKMSSVDLKKLSDEDLETVYNVLEKYFKKRYGGKPKGHRKDRGAKHFKAFAASISAKKQQ